MVDNLRLLKNFVVGMGIVLFLGFFLLIFLVLYKLSNTNVTCTASEIVVTGKILDFIPVSDKAVGIVSSQDSQKILTIYDYCSGVEQKKISFTEE